MKSEATGLDHGLGMWVGVRVARALVGQAARAIWSINSVSRPTSPGVIEAGGSRRSIGSRATAAVAATSSLAAADPASLSTTARTTDPVGGRRDLYRSSPGVNYIQDLDSCGRPPGAIVARARCRCLEPAPTAHLRSALEVSFSIVMFVVLAVRPRPRSSIER